MSAFAVASPSRSRLGTPTLEDRLIARMLGRSLDRELAAGARAQLSGAHAARAAQLTGVRSRRAVAESLDRLIDRAEAPASRFQITTAPCRQQVCQAKETIRAIAARLRSAEPIDPGSVARLKVLIADPAGPCYAPSRAEINERFKQAFGYDLP